MKKITLFILGIFFSNAALAQDPIVPDYTNNFSTESPLWTYADGPLAGPVTPVEANDWDYYDYGNQSDGPNGFSAYFNLFSYGESTNQWFISPTFNLSADTYYLNFDVALTEYADTTPATFTGNEFATFMKSEDDGATWTEMLRWDNTTPISNEGQAITEITLMLTGNAKFAFYTFVDAESENDADFFVDNFKITQNSLGVVQNEASQFKFYPNPVRDILTLSNNESLKDVAIYNMLGQQVLFNDINAMEGTLDLSGLVSGNYIAKVTTGNATKTIKLIKQ